MKNIFIPAVIFLVLSTLWSSCKQDQYDLIIRGGMIYDGLGNEAYKADLGIFGDKIIRIGDALTCDSCRIIDAEGLSVSPGFIDLHAHLEPLPLLPDASSALHMGVTTALGGPDGSSPIQLGNYLDSLQALGMGINVAYLTGHNSIRAEVMGFDNRAPSIDELEKMKDLVTKGMEEGAFGISTGLKYLPGTFSKVDEVIEVSKRAAEAGGFYTSHLREEGLGLLGGVREAIIIARDANIPVVLTHHKVVGQPMWGSSVKTLGLVDSARSAGLDVMIDQYPYTASYTSLSILIPAWAMAGGRYDQFAMRCEDPVLRDSIKRGIIFNIINDRGGNDLSRVQLARFNWKPHLEGKTLGDWAIEEGLEPTPETGAELIIEAQLHRGANAIFHAMDEDDVRRIMAHPMTMIASDGRITEYNKGFPHPRAYGTFPRVIGHYAREKGYFTVEEAIRKMTSLPAKRMGLKDRGIIQPGLIADLVIFNAQTIVDKSDFKNPHQYPDGIQYVLVNGKLAIDNGQLSKERYGLILRGPAYKRQEK